MSYGFLFVMVVPLFLNAVQFPFKFKTNTVFVAVATSRELLHSLFLAHRLGSTVDNSRQIPYGYAYLNLFGRMRPCVWLLVIGAWSKLPSIVSLGKAPLQGNLSLRSERKL